jgi:hypothetical protein
MGEALCYVRKKICTCYDRIIVQHRLIVLYRPVDCPVVRAQMLSLIDPNSDPVLRLNYM